MAHRPIYECIACCDKHCTIRTWGDLPEKCVYWKDNPCWIRKDKHKQKELREYAD